MEDLHIEKSVPWGFFDGPSHGDPLYSSENGILFLYDSHFIGYEENVEIGSNNHVEFQAPRILLKYALD